MLLNKISDFVLKHPVITIGTIVLITILFALNIPNIRMETDIKNMIPENYPSVDAYNEIDEKFSGSEVIFIAATHDNIFNPSTLQKINDLANELKEVSGITRVFSITQMDEIKAVEDGIEVAPVIDTIPESKAEMSAFKKKLLSDIKYKDIFVSSDGQAVLIMAKLSADRDQSQLILDVTALIDQYKNPEKFYLSGSPAIIETVGNSMKNDLSRLFPLSILLLAIILFISFRNWYGVVFPLLNVVVSVIWTIGGMALLNLPLTVVSSIMPVLLITVGSAYGIHIISRYQEENKKSTLQCGVNNTLKKVIHTTGVGVFVAAITTAVGFISNSVSGISGIRYFGLATAFGIMSAFFVSVTFIPALLSIIKPKVKNQSAKDKEDLLKKLLNRQILILTEKRFINSMIAAVILLIAIISYPQLTAESEMIKYFKPDSDIARAFQLISDRFGGSMTIDILVNGDLKDPALLKKMEQLQEEMKKIKYVNNPTSIVNALKETNRFMNDDKEEFEVLPDKRDGVAQYLLLLSMTGEDFLGNLITADYESGIIQARVSTSISTAIDDLVIKTEKLVQEIIGDLAVVKVSGMATISKDSRAMIISTQIQSLSLALIAVFIMIFLIYRTVIGSIFCMVPIILTILYNFGIMGWFKIPIDMATVMIGSIAVGIGIDYTVHFFNRYKEERKAGRARNEGIKITISTVGRAIIYNATAVAMGFAVLMLSEFRILANFGMLTALTMLFATFGALAVLPDLIMLKFRLIDLKNRGENK
ncbi:RND family transporter [Candidatus Margulisiibacteriota bacterium]